MPLNMKKYWKFPRAKWRADVPLDSVARTIEDFKANDGLVLNPDFQRGHVWTAEQQKAYIEYMLSGGQSGLEIYFNHPGWMGDWKGDFVCVDGLQRLTAVIDFLNDKFQVLDGINGSEIGFQGGDYRLSFNICTLQTRAEVLDWYLLINAGGTPHSKEEIDRVRTMLEQEKANV